MYIDKKITIIIYGKLKLMKIDISSEIHRTGKDLKYIYIYLSTLPVLICTYGSQICSFNYKEYG